MLFLVTTTTATTTTTTTTAANSTTAKLIAIIINKLDHITDIKSSSDRLFSGFVWWRKQTYFLTLSGLSRRGLGPFGSELREAVWIYTLASVLPSCLGNIHLALHLWAT